MSTVRLTCPCGHSWNHSRAEAIPADLRAICPVCSRSSENPSEPLPTSGSSNTGSRDSEFAAPTTSSGRVVEGFEIMEEINRGGMGVIFRARQIAMNRLVAFKAINPTKLEQPGTRDRFDAEVAVIHRHGVVPIGEVAVAIAAAAVHRAEAYEANRYVIEAIKERLPIWKRERFADGTEWKRPGA